jgi:hypothetical protein
MKAIDLFENWQFDPKGPHADPLHVDKNGRAILFTLGPQQTIRGHNVPSSPFFVVILTGRGFFAGGDGLEREVGANTVLCLNPANITQFVPWIISSLLVSYTGRPALKYSCTALPRLCLNDEEYEKLWTCQVQEFPNYGNGLSIIVLGVMLQLCASKRSCPSTRDV